MQAHKNINHWIFWLRLQTIIPTMQVDQKKWNSSFVEIAKTQDTQGKIVQHYLEKFIIVLILLLLHYILVRSVWETNSQITGYEGFEEGWRVNQVTKIKVGTTILILNYIFSVYKGDSGPYLTVDIFGSKIKSLLDSGSTRSIFVALGRNFIRSLGLNIRNSMRNNCTAANVSTC